MFSILPYRYNNQVSRRVPESRDFLSPFFDDFFRPFFGQSAMGGMKVDVEDKDDHYELTADLPGVSKENLKVDETREFVASAFAEGHVSEDGTAVTKILKPRSRFGKNAGHADSKTRALDRLKAFFAKYREVAPGK